MSNPEGIENFIMPDLAAPSDTVRRAILLAGGDETDFENFIDDEISAGQNQ